MSPLLLLAKESIPRRIRFRIRRVLHTLRGILYAGGEVLCPWCNRRFRRFLQHGKYFGPNLNTYCPNCGAFERHRLQWLYFRNRTNLFVDNLVVLHIAPEYGLQKVLKRQANLSYVSSDLDSPLAMVHTDIAELPYRDNSFDVILCNHVLEHVEKDREAIRELFRVLRCGGWAMILVPIDKTRWETFEDPAITSPTDRKRFYWQHDHLRLYGCDFIERLREGGFQATIDTYARDLDSGTIRVYGVNGLEELYICTKPESKEHSADS